MKERNKMREIGIRYIEEYERGQPPTLEELVERYPDLSDEVLDELISFVMDFVSVERTDDDEIPEGVWEVARDSRDRALEVAFAGAGSLTELRKLNGMTVRDVGEAVHLPFDVLVKLERGLLVPGSIPEKLFDRLATALGRSSEQVRALASLGNCSSASHFSASSPPSAERDEEQTFEQAMLRSPSVNEDFKNDWLENEPPVGDE
jgi:transcriptional regulator with XRE-family HTH domain